jgi:hypothetical protein
MFATKEKEISFFWDDCLPPTQQQQQQKGSE